MGCGTSSHVIAPPEEPAHDHDKITNGSNGSNAHAHDKKEREDHDDLPTVVLPETPVKKPPIAFEIPIEELDTSHKGASSPPPHIQRLLQPPPQELTLPDIEGKLAEAESRRQMILQQRAASAQKRAQKMMKALHEMDKLDSEHEPMDLPDTTKHGTNTLKIPPESSAWEDRNI